MQAFIDHLQQFVSLTDKEIETITANIYIEEIPAKSYVLEAGQVSRRLGFILKGVARIYHIDKEGKEVIRCFHNENHFVGDLSSYQANSVTNEYIQAISDCTIVFFNKSNDEFLNQNLEKWPHLVRLLTEAALMDKVYNMSNLIHADAKTKYLDFLQKHADIVQRIPLGDLASYLGIAQQSLSRIRKNITL